MVFRALSKVVSISSRVSPAGSAVCHSSQRFLSASHSDLASESFRIASDRGLIIFSRSALFSRMLSL